MIFRNFFAVIIIAASPAVAVAQDSGTMTMDHGNMGSQALMDTNETMMKAMQGMQMTGDTDRDFAAMMIDHHQGAIDMAKAELEHGKDPEMRKMAEEIIAAQEKEIAMFNASLPARIWGKLMQMRAACHAQPRRGGALQ